jgi:predicted dehydrogenase
MFIGAGNMARSVHYPSLASFEDVDLAGICDLNTQRAQEAARQYNVANISNDYRKMAEEIAPDAVYAVGPPHYMYDVWVWCLQQGLNLFVEKPLGITLHQARCLAYLAEKHGCITQVGFQRRAAPMVVKLHEECLKRGPIVHAICRFYKCMQSPYLDAPAHMMDDGVHAIDTLRWLCGGEVARIHSVSRRVGTPDLNFLSALMEFDNGATGMLINSWSSGRRIFDVEMHAPGICVEAEHEGEGYLYADGDTQGVVYDTKEVSQSNENFVYGGFQAKNREFIDAVINRTLPSSHFGDALKTMEVAERILAQETLKLESE